MPGKAPEPIRQRFERYVDRRGPLECWPWRGPRDGQGRGILANVTLEDGTYLGTVGAHVLAVILDGRERPAGYHAHHECLNRSCVNPVHIVCIDPREHVAIHTELRRREQPKGAD